MEPKARAATRFKPLPQGPAIDGTLFVTLNHVRWTPVDKQIEAVDIDASYITGHKNSKETSPKAMLKLILAKHPKLGDECMFEFSTFPDRNRCSSVVALLVKQRKAAGGAPASAPPPPQHAQISKEVVDRDIVARRMKALESDEELGSLFYQLVGSNILSEADFWSAHKSALDKEGDLEVKQQTGLRTPMLAALRPTMDGNTNTVSFKLTPEIVHQIFAEKPAVHQAFIQHVGTRKMTEGDFWTKYCKAEYKFRQRQMRKDKRGMEHLADDDDDLALFSASNNNNNAVDVQARNKIKRVDPTLDIVADTADDYLHISGHGTARRENEATTDAGGAGAAGEEGRDGGGASRRGGDRESLFRELNRHAAVVLEGRPKGDKMGADTASIASSLLAQQMSDPEAEKTEDNEARRRERIHEMTQMEDLQPRPAPSLVPLSIDDPSKYFEAVEAGAQTAAGQGLPAENQTRLDPAAAARAFQRLSAEFGGRAPMDERGLMPPGVAAEVLGDLNKRLATAGRVTGGGQAGLFQSLPDHLRRDIVQHTAKSNELLRHFWSSYPITAAFLQEKVMRLKPAISSEYDALEAYKGSVPPNWRHQAGQLLKPLQEALSTAVQFYEERSKSDLGKFGPRAANGVPRPGPPQPTPAVP